MIALLLLLLLLLAPSALASTSRPSSGSFGIFTEPQALTVDQSSGDVYVVDPSEGTVSRFDSAGAAHAFTCATCSGNALSGFSFDSPSAAEVAIAPAGAAGGTAGDIYVASLAGVDVFASDGTHLGQITQANGAGFGEACGVATDNAGKLYVGDFSGKIDRYVPSANAPTNGDYDAQITGVSSPCNIAADSTGTVYASTWSTGPLTKYAATDFGTSNSGIQIDAASRAVAVDPSTDDIYVDEGSRIQVFDSSGTSLYTFGSAADFGSNSAGVAVTGLNGNAYVADRTNGQIDIFGPAVVHPDVTTGAADDLTSTSATLHGSVNPDNVAVTDCHFDYVDAAHYNAAAPNPYSGGASAPCAESVGSGSAAVSVHADVTGLASGTLYHFRLVASNANGTVQGADQTFSLGPSVAGEQATNVSTSSATLAASINPNGDPTTYHFEYGNAGPCDSNPCLSTPDQSAGQGSDPVPVSAPLDGLTPATSYYFRLVATNSVGTGTGSDAIFATYGSASSFAPCPNEQFRTGPSSRLPDCRAFEQASPIDKNGGDVYGGERGFIQASSGGGAINFLSNAGIPGGVGGGDFGTFLAIRGPSAWSTAGLLPPASTGANPTVRGATPDFSQTFTESREGFGAPVTFYSRASSDGSVTPIATSPFNFFFWAGASADSSKVFFQTAAQLTPDGSGSGQKLYRWDRTSNTLTLVGVLPDSACGTPPCLPSGSFAGTYRWFSGTDSGTLELPAANSLYFIDSVHAISPSGDQAYFTAGSTGQLYLRQGLNGPSPTTVQVSAAQGPPDPNGPKPAIFMNATPSGSKVLFTSCEKLTSDSTAVSTADFTCDTDSQGQDLYSYDAAINALTDLTVDGADPRGADVKGVIGASDSGSEVYFAANGVLAPGATLGTCSGPPQSLIGDCNLYRSHSGSITFIARLTGTTHSGLQDNWTPSADFNSADGAMRAGRVSPDGATLLFSSEGRLTAYDNHGMAELYRYHGGDLACVSCVPTGAPPTGPASVEAMQPSAPNQPVMQTNFLTRNLSVDGSRVFFDSPDKLVAADTNGDRACAEHQFGAADCIDVYEWEADGAGSCTQASSAFSAQDDGCLYLLSAGTGSSTSNFADASASGDDVFIFTRAQLVPGDVDGLVDVYDVRVGGGLASQHAAPPAGCSGDACQGAQTPPPNAPGSGSAIFSGSGNPIPASSASSARPILRVTSKSGKGSAVTLTVSISAKGRLTITGAGLKRFTEAFAKAGSYRITIKLNPTVRKALRRKRKLTLKARLAYSPASGKPLGTTVTVTVQRGGVK